MKVLVTGAAGFIGSSLCRELQVKGHEVFAVDSLITQVHGHDPAQSNTFRALLAVQGIAFRRSDVTDIREYEDWLRECDVVVHLAAETGTGQSMYEVGRYFDANVMSLSALLSALRSGSRCKRVVISSSRAVYGEGAYHDEANNVVYPESRSSLDLDRGIFECINGDTGRVLRATPTKEDAKIAPKSIYGLTKYAQESMVKILCDAMGIASSVLRYQNVYGPGQSLSNPYTGILSIFSTRFLRNEPINIFEDGMESRDFVYIDDVVSATVAATLMEDRKSGTFNVGSGEAQTVMNVAQMLRQRYSSKSEIVVTGQYRLGDIRHNIADISNSTQHIGYRPEVSFEDGLDRFCNWVLSQPATHGGYEKSLGELKSAGLLKGGR